MTSSYIASEIASQPEVWRRAARLGSESAAVLPQSGQRVAVVGCGTSWFIAQAYAAHREQLGHGVTDAFAASEYPAQREYDLLIAITRSGRTTEVLQLLDEVRGSQRTLAVIGDTDSSGAGAADAVIALPFADEQSVVQTRFATSVLTMLRAGLGEDMEPIARAAESVVTWEVPQEVHQRSQFTFLGRGLGVGLAHEAALKMREATISWAESYPAMDYRHGPKAITDERSFVVFLGERPEGLVAEVEELGALTLAEDEDPQLTLVRCQLLAAARAVRQGQDPDRPRNLTRSIVLAQQMTGAAEQTRARRVEVLTVTPNPAWDVTYPVDALRAGESIRVTGAAARAGGKGINVARVVGDLGGRCVAVAPVGGMRRRAFAESLADAAVPASLVEVPEELRQSVAVVPQGDGAEPTLFDESGEALSEESWQALIRAVGEVVARMRPKVVVISGSMPPGTRQEHLAALVEAGRAGGQAAGDERDAGVAVLVDTSGDALLWAVRAGADLVTPNRAEALAATGTSSLEEAAEALREAGAGQVLITDGGEGMQVVSADGVWSARCARQVSGNPTGAGDAASAALALSWDDPWPERLRAAVAASAAAVAEPVAGKVDPGVVADVRRSVDVEERP